MREMTCAMELIENFAWVVLSKVCDKMKHSTRECEVRTAGDMVTRPGKTAKRFMTHTH